MTRTQQQPASSPAGGLERSPGGLDGVLWVLVLLIPFISWGVVPWLTGPYVLMIAGALLVTLKGDHARGRLQIPAAPVWVPLAAVLGLSLIHLIRSPVPYSSLLFLVQASVAITLYYLLWHRPNAEAPVTIALTWTCVLVPWIAFKVLFLGIRAHLGPFLNPNYTATVLLVCLALILGQLTRPPEGHRRKGVLLAAAVSGSIGLLLIGSRSAGLGMILLWLVYLLFGKGRLRLVSLVVIAMIVLLPSTTRYRVTEEYKVDPHAFSRLRIWKASLRMGADHPLIGVGPNLFYDYGPGYAFPMDELPVRYGRIARKPHNEYLKSWAEGGAVGVAALGLLLVIVMRMALRALREGKTGPVLASAVLFYQAFFHDITEVFSLIVMMAWCLAQITPGESRSIDLREGWRRFLPAGLGVTILCFSMAMGLDLAARYFWQKGAALMKSDAGPARASLLTSTRINPLLPGAERDLARILLVKMEETGSPGPDRVLEALAKARRLNRRDTAPLRLEAALYIREARTGEMPASKGLAMAAARLGEAAALEPHNALIRLSQAEVYWDLNQRGRALDLVSQALAMEPNYLEALRKNVSWLSVVDPRSARKAEAELLEARERISGYRANSDYEGIILK